MKKPAGIAAGGPGAIPDWPGNDGGLEFLRVRR